MFSVFTDKPIVFCKYIKQQNVTSTTEAKQDLKVSGNTVLEGSTISSLTGSR